MRNRSASGSLILVLDENLSGHRIIKGLKSLDIPVKAQTELMERGISDEKVLKTLAKYPEYYLLSKDSDFHKKPMVKEALVEHKAGAFIITAHKGKTAPELVELINKAWAAYSKVCSEKFPSLCGKNPC